MLTSRKEIALRQLADELSEAHQVRGRIEVLLAQLRGHHHQLGEALYRADRARQALVAALDGTPPDAAADATDDFEFTTD
jgi:hypothetical protein